MAYYEKLKNLVLQTIQLQVKVQFQCEVKLIEDWYKIERLEED